MTIVLTVYVAMTLWCLDNIQAGVNSLYDNYRTISLLKMVIRHSGWFSIGKYGKTLLVLWSRRQ